MAVHTQEAISRVANIQNQFQFWAGVIGLVAAILGLVSLIVGKRKESMIRAPRRLVAIQIKALSDSLAASRAEIDIQAMNANTETLTFAKDLAEAFRKAGWKSSGVTPTGALGDHEGFWLAFSKHNRPQAEFVKAAFKAVGLDLPIVEQTCEMPQLNLIIASKPRFLDP